MYSEAATRMMGDLFLTGLLICLPVMACVMTVGLAISLLQVATQVQEMSLTFVPKLVTASIALVAFGPWMLRQLTQYATRLWMAIPSMF